MFSLWYWINEKPFIYKTHLSLFNCINYLLSGRKHKFLRVRHLAFLIRIAVFWWIYFNAGLLEHCKIMTEIPELRLPQWMPSKKESELNNQLEQYLTKGPQLALSQFFWLCVGNSTAYGERHMSAPRLTEEPLAAAGAKSPVSLGRWMQVGSPCSSNVQTLLYMHMRHIKDRRGAYIKYIL